MNVYTNKELKSKDYIFLFFLFYMGEKKKPLKNKSSNTDPRLNNIFSKKPLKNQSLKTDKLDRLLKRPKIPAPQPPTTPRSSKRFTRRKNGELSKKQQVVRAMQDLHLTDKEQKRKRTKEAIAKYNKRKNPFESLKF